MRFERRLLAGQGLFYLATGAWPLVDRASFEKVTGPKTDFWLVRTVGALVAVVGVGLLVAARERHASVASRVVAGGAAAALAAVDIVYAGTGRIAPIYLVDAAVELALASSWVGTSLPRRRPSRPEILMGEQVEEM